MTKKISLLVVGFLIAFSAGQLAQSQVSGAIQGRVIDETGTALPGVMVTLSSPSLMGTRSFVSGADGQYRFPALPGGTYVIEASLQGFTPVKRTEVVLHVGTTVSIDLVLPAAKLEAEVMVIAEAPLVDVTDAATGKTFLTRDVMENVPTQRNMAQVFTLAPGVVSTQGWGAVAYGGSPVSNTFQMDGVDIGDSWMGGGEYTATVDYEAVEETQVLGMGAPAEYGGFTGVITNIITKSGGNSLHGDVMVFFQGKNWQGNNIDPDDPQYTLLGESPALNMVDPSFHLGGPIIKDKLWFFGGFDYYKEDQTLGELTGNIQFPKGSFKLTFQPDAKNRFQVSATYHRKQWRNPVLSPLVAPEAQYDWDYPVRALNLNYLHTFSSNTIFEAKVSGYQLDWKSIPVSRDPNTPGHYDVVTGEYYVNSYWWSVFGNKKISGTASISHRLDGLLGSHDLKAGFDMEISESWGKYKPNGGVWYQDYLHQPYLGIYFEFLEDGRSRRYTGYLQDSWKITDSLVINPGLRYGITTGEIPMTGETVYKPASLVEPRIGLVWDIFKDYRTVLKAHYGRYYEGTKTWYYTLMTPTVDTVMYAVWPEWSGITEIFRIPAQDLYTMDPDIKHPSADQFVLGIERSLGQNMMLSVSYTHKNFRNMIAPVNTGGTFVPVSYTDPASGETLTVYSQTNPGADHYYITNPVAGKDIGAAYPGIVSATPYRTYDGVQIALQRRFSNRLQFFASYIYSQEKGNLPNYGNWDTYPGQTKTYYDPNNQINFDGRLAYALPHVFKLHGTYVLPLDIYLSAFLNAQSGVRWTRRLAVPLPQGAVTPMVESQGSQQLPFATKLDLRVEKSFAIKGTRLSASLDIFNVFNAANAESVMDTIGPNFEKVTWATAPRSFRAGLRFYF